jgi:hypothetical protein
MRCPGLPGDKEDDGDKQENHERIECMSANMSESERGKINSNSRRLTPWLRLLCFNLQQNLE